MPLTPSTLITRALEGNPSFTKRGLILTAALVFKIQGNPGKKKKSSPVQAKLRNNAQSFKAGQKETSQPLS